MKKIKLYYIVMLVASTMVSAAAMAQNGSAGRDRDWVPDNGYWEVITTEAQPRSAIVRFYDLNRHLIYEEQVEGIVLDLHRRSTCRRLNRSLQMALAAWTKTRQVMKDMGIVAMKLRRD
jgi:hypothetical protein